MDNNPITINYYGFGSEHLKILIERITMVHIYTTSTKVHQNVLVNI